MLEKITAILSEHTTATEIHAGSTLEQDLDLSSFDIMEIVMAFEDEFHIEISDRDIHKFVTVQDIQEYLEEKL